MDISVYPIQSDPGFRQKDLDPIPIQEFWIANRIDDFGSRSSTTLPSTSWNSSDCLAGVLCYKKSMLYSLSHREKKTRKRMKSLSADEFLFLFCSALLSLFLFSFECVVSIADSAISGKSASIKWWKAQLESHSRRCLC